MELRKIISSISVEPPYLLISLSYGLFAIMVQGLYIDKGLPVSSSEFNLNIPNGFPLICSLVTQKFRILKLCFLSIEDERGGTIIIDTTRFAKLTLHSTWKSATTSRTTQRSRSGCKSTSLHCSRTTECFRPSRPLCTPSLPGLGRTSTAGRCS